MLKQFLSVDDVADPLKLVEEAVNFKKQPNAFRALGQHKSLALLFFNSSLRTRLSSQRAAQLLGMDHLLVDVATGWPLEFEDGAIMDQDKSEHIREASAVIAQYCDFLGVRCFPTLKDRDHDYGEPILNALKKHADIPLINLESATRHPLQGLADMITIREHKKRDRPKVLLTWAPHPRALPQSVANSFAAWSLACKYDLTITHPEGYELDPTITYGATIEYDPYKAYEDADFVYAKNWSSYRDYGQIASIDKRWMVDVNKMKNTNDAHFMHCLPVRRNVIVQDEVINSANSLVIQQANNRTFSAATVLKNLLTP